MTALADKANQQWQKSACLLSIPLLIVMATNAIAVLSVFLYVSLNRLTSLNSCRDAIDLRPLVYNLWETF